MRKRIINSEPAVDQAAANTWLDLEQLAEVEISSEDPDHPIEAALGASSGSGWRAGKPGPQTIRLLFAQPQQIRRIYLAFHEESHHRTQEFAVRWSADHGQTFHDLLRQQYTFSPPGTTSQVEDYQVELNGVTLLALQIVPDIGGKPLHAGLASLRVASQR